MITNYDELKSTMADWLMRADLVPVIPAFIQLAESRFNRVLRGREMIVRSRAITSDQFVSLPADWLKAKNIQRISDGKPLGIMTYEEIDQYRRFGQGQHAINDGETGGAPEFYAIVGGALELAPSPTPTNPAEIEMIYYGKFVGLSESKQTNWLLSNHPDVYLYESLTHSAPYLKDDARLAVWQTRANTAMQELNLSDADARWSGAPLTRRFTHDIN